MRDRDNGSEVGCRMPDSCHFSVLVPDWGNVRSEGPYLSDATLPVPEDGERLVAATIPYRRLPYRSTASQRDVLALARFVELPAVCVILKPSLAYIHHFSRLVKINDFFGPKHPQCLTTTAKRAQGERSDIASTSVPLRNLLSRKATAEGHPPALASAWPGPKHRTFSTIACHVPLVWVMVMSRSSRW